MSKLLMNIPRHKRVLVDIVEDGSAKTFVYRDITEENKTRPARRLLGWFIKKHKKNKH